MCLLSIYFMHLEVRHKWKMDINIDTIISTFPTNTDAYHFHWNRVDNETIYFLCTVFH